jgi:hypothetical protein
MNNRFKSRTTNGRISIVLEQVTDPDTGLTWDALPTVDDAQAHWDAVRDMATDTSVSV